MTRDDLDQLVHEHDAVVLLLTEGGCQVAEAVAPRVEALLRERFPEVVRVVVAKDEAPELAAQLGVFVFPAVIAWFAGRESARFVRSFSLDVLADALERPYELLFG